jgi:hypothetical protein
MADLNFEDKRKSCNTPSIEPRFVGREVGSALATLTVPKFVVQNFKTPDLSGNKQARLS